MALRAAEETTASASQLGTQGKYIREIPFTLNSASRILGRVI
jgi:hypothetical protein